MPVDGGCDGEDSLREVRTPLRLAVGVLCGGVHETSESYEKQRDDALSTLQKLTANLDENKSKTVKEVAERLP